MHHRHHPEIFKLSPGTFSLIFGLLLTLLLLLLLAEKAG